jgi:glutamine cyclotransferase
MWLMFLVFMDKDTLAAILIVTAILIAGGIWAVLMNYSQAPTDSGSPTRYTYHIVKTYPHDTAAFTEGLVFSNGSLYESTGEYGYSSLRRVNLENGTVQQEFLLPSQYFGEGLTAINDSLIQLTWQEKIGFVYDKQTFGLLGNFSFSTQGWGLTYNGSELIMSDGTSNLYFLNPVTYQKVGQISVHDGKAPVTNINELEYVNGTVYANIWHQQKIAIINPQTGTVKGWIDLTGIYQSNGIDDVLNGIAYDEQTNSLYVTGKDWPYLYQIAITITK